MTAVPQARIDFLIWERPDKLLKLLKYPEMLIDDLVKTARAVEWVCRGMEDPDYRLDAENAQIMQEAPKENLRLSELIQSSHSEVLERALDRADAILRGEEG